MKSKECILPDAIDSAILDFLKANGPHLDSEIADALSLSLTQVRDQVAVLSSSGDLICCSTIKFKAGVSIEGISCRVSCYIPPAARGRKPGNSVKPGAVQVLE